MYFFLNVNLLLSLFCMYRHMWKNSKLGTHGNPRRRGTGHEPPPPPVKNLGLGDVKRFIEGMHNTETIAG